MTTLLQKLVRSAAGLCLVLSATLASATPIRDTTGFMLNTLERNDDGSAGPIDIGFDICFGQRWSQLYVNNNGNVSFGQALGTFTPFSLANSPVPIIAPFFADVDTRNVGSGVVTYGTGQIGGQDVFVVNYPSVGYYPASIDKTNDFQLVLFDLGGGNFRFEFNYANIEWETGNASGGSGGLGGISAAVGYNNGAGKVFELPGSRVNGAFINGGPNQLITAMKDSDGVLGRLVFECNDCREVPEPGTLSLVFAALGAIALIRRRTAGNPA